MKDKNDMVWTQIAQKVATSLVPKIAEELYDYASSNIDEFREYLSEVIKPNKVEEYVKEVKERLTLSVPEIEWVRSNYHYWFATGNVVCGTEVEDFTKYCNEKFSNKKKVTIAYSDRYWIEIARKGVNYYSYPENLDNDGKVLEHTFPSDSKLHLLPLKYYELTGYDIGQIRTFRDKRRFS